MELLLKRVAKKETYTIGKLYINGEYFCDTLEDKDRGLTDNMTVEEILKRKVYAKTAIPTGKYRITLNVVSPKNKNKPIYQFCKARIPRLLNVKGFAGILMHIGTTDANSAGCILVGENKIVGRLVNSDKTFFKLYSKLEIANKNRENITIEIQ